MQENYENGIAKRHLTDRTDLQQTKARAEKRIDQVRRVRLAKEEEMEVCGYRFYWLILQCRLKYHRDCFSVLQLIMIFSYLLIIPYSRTYKT